LRSYRLSWADILVGLLIVDGDRFAFAPSLSSRDLSLDPPRE